MGIREQTQDAEFLAANERHLGALTILMLAIAASARRRLPKGTKSLENPKNAMGDRESFTLFIGGRIRSVLFGGYGADEIGPSGIQLSFKTKQYDLAYILYKYYRCELVHEGELPKDIEFGNDSVKDLTIGMGSAGPSISITSGDLVCLGHGWIDLLIRCVTLAPCNNELFGIKGLVSKSGIDEQGFEDATVTKYEISPGRFKILREAVKFISSDTIRSVSDDQVCREFLMLVADGRVNGNALTGLSSHNLASQTGDLLPSGLAILREIADAYDSV